MSRLYNTFDFVGELGFAKEPTVISEVGNKGWKKKRLSVLVKETDNNGVFVQFETLFHPTIIYPIKTQLKGLYGAQQTNGEIPWENRLINSTVDTVPDYRKIIVDLTPQEVDKTKYFESRKELFNLERKENPSDTDKSRLVELYDLVRNELPDRKEFLHVSDVIDHLKDKLEGLKGKKVRIKGDIVKSHYNGKFYTNYSPKSIELVSDDYVNELKLNLDLFFKKGAVEDKSEKENSVYFDTYIIGYDNGHKKDVFFPFPTVLNTSKLDLTNEKHQAILKMQKKQFESAKSKEVNHIAVIAKLVRGAEEVAFDESHLTSQQKEMVELGLAKLEDYKPKGTVLGESIEEVRIVKPLLQKMNEKNDFSDGALVSAFEPSDLEYVAPEGQSSPPPKKEEPAKTVEEDDLGSAFEEDDLESLFG